MKLCSAKHMAHRLAHRAVSSMEKGIYLILFIVQFIFPIQVFSFLPFFYTTVFSLARDYVLKESNGNLHIKIYTFPQYFPSALFAMAIIGIVLCYLTNKGGDDKHFFSRFICLQWPTSMCMILITGILFGIIIGIAGTYFTAQLMAIGTQTKAGSNLLQSLLHQINRLNLIHHIVQGLNNFKKATAIIKQINKLSHILYLGTVITTLFSTWSYFLIIQVYLSKIAQKK